MSLVLSLLTTSFYYSLELIYCFFFPMVLARKLHKQDDGSCDDSFLNSARRRYFYVVLCELKELGREQDGEQDDVCTISRHPLLLTA
mmetsp:Transcript_21883/g.47760  ORF Transcript_21883/g.47760 Transcript_21883/m.47760 type:complete len:87 (-) Transcript_21883:337-597(-)